MDESHHKKCQIPYEMEITRTCSACKEQKFICQFCSYQKKGAGNLVVDEYSNQLSLEIETNVRKPNNPQPIQQCNRTLPTNPRSILPTNPKIIGH